MSRSKKFDNGVVKSILELISSNAGDMEPEAIALVDYALRCQCGADLPTLEELKKKSQEISKIQEAGRKAAEHFKNQNL